MAGKSFSEEKQDFTRNIPKIVHRLRMTQKLAVVALKQWADSVSNLSNVVAAKSNVAVHV